MNIDVLKKNRNVILFISVIFVVLFVFNAIFPVQSDDINSTLGGFVNAKEAYLTNNGRLGELLKVAFGGYLSTTPFYAPVNALGGIILILLCFYIIMGRLPKDSLKDMTILVVFWLFLLFDPEFAFGSVFFWAAGSFNYLLAWLLLLLWAVPYRKFYKNHFENADEKINSLTTSIYVFVIGFFAGWTSELFIVFFIVGILSIAYLLVTKKKIPAWYYIGLVSLFIGWLIVYKCPGLAVRASKAESYMSLSEIFHLKPVDFIKKIISAYDVTYKRAIRFHYLILCIVFDLFAVICAIFEKTGKKNVLISVCSALIIGCSMFVSKLMMLVLMCIYCVYKICQKDKNRDFTKNYIIVLCLLFVDMLFIASVIQTKLPKRAMIQHVLISFAIVIMIIKACFEYFNDNKKVQKLAFIICLFCSAAFTVFVTEECFAMTKKWSDMVTSIEKQKSEGITDVKVPLATFKSRWWNYGDWANPLPGNTDYVNQIYANFFGVEYYTVE